MLRVTLHVIAMWCITAKRLVDILAVESCFYCTTFYCIDIQNAGFFPSIFFGCLSPNPALLLSLRQDIREFESRPYGGEKISFFY